MNKNKKKTEVDPVPTIPAFPPSVPEITPQPDKNKPEQPLPEIIPFHNTPEIKQVN